MKLDFFARRAYYLDHLAPVWNALPAARRGVFHIDAELEPYARQELQAPRLEVFQGGVPPGEDPVLTAAYGDLNKVIRNPARRILTMEHGVTQGFQTAAYPGGANGNRMRTNLALLPNEYVARYFRAAREIPHAVIGTPKMDAFAGTSGPLGHMDPVVAIAFHWGNRKSNPPESGSAFEHYRQILPELARRYKMIGHSHPLASPEHREAMERTGIEWVEDFREVLRRADVYLNDLSSTMYEFLVTGKPVVLLNAPWFRREVYWGIRFWDYSDVGILVERPEDLCNAVDRTLAEYASIRLEERRRAVADLYPFLGYAAQSAAAVLTAALDKWEAG